MKGILIFIISFIQFLSISQELDANSELELLQKKMVSKYLSGKVETIMYSDGQEQNSLTQLSSFYYGPTNSYSNNNGQIIIHEQNSVLIIDELNRVVHYEHEAFEDYKSQKKALLEFYKDAKSTGDVQFTVSSKGTTRKLTASGMSSSDFETIIIEYSTDYVLQKVTYTYEKGRYDIDKIVITYNNINFSKQSDSEYKIENYITVNSKGEYSLNSKYSEYQKQ